MHVAVPEASSLPLSAAVSVASEIACLRPGVADAAAVRSPAVTIPSELT
jgi:hypothetical protein